jgi:hypothetical protein
MPGTQSLLQILAAADAADAEDVAIRTALYNALRGIEEDFVTFAADAPNPHMPRRAPRAPSLMSRSPSAGKRRLHGPNLH